MIAVLYEHPEWFKPLFATLERRHLPWTAVDAASLRWDPTERPAFDLLVNRMSPSAWTRGHGHAIQSTLAYLHYVERWGIPIVNGLDAWRLEISKSAQLDLFERLGVPYPKARVINHASQAVAAAEGLRFPVVVKPNIGGSGAGIQRFDAMADLAAAVAAGSVALGMDDTALVQEFLPARGGHITRLEILQHQLLYAIAITPPKGHGFNLCPADICQVDDNVAAARGRRSRRLPGGLPGQAGHADRGRRRSGRGGVPGAGHLASRRAGRLRHRISGGPPGRRALLLRRERPLELRHRRPPDRRIRPVRAPGGRNRGQGVGRPCGPETRGPLAT